MSLTFYRASVVPLVALAVLTVVSALAIHTASAADETTDTPAITTAVPALEPSPENENESPAIRKLVEQALHWQSRGEWSKAATAWDKILLSDPAHPEALRGQFYHALQTGEITEAKLVVKLMRNRNRAHPYLVAMEQSLAAAVGGESALERAREYVREGKLLEALEQYRITFGGVEPNGTLALEYYTTLGGAPGEWQNAAQGLERLLADNPDNAEFALAYAKHLTYDRQRRRDGIARLAELGSNREVADAALAARRQALIWLDRAHTDLPLYEAYLAVATDDEEIRALLDQTRRSRTPSQEKLAKSAFDALSAEQYEAAATSFRQLIRTRPRDADALAGLGITELRQRDYSNAALHLSAALDASPRQRADWRDALDTARYWSAIEIASDAMLSSDTALATEQVDIALAIDATEEIGLVMKAELLHQARDMPAAEEYYRAALAKNAENVVALRGLGRLLNDLERFDESEALARRSRELDVDGSTSIASTIIADSLVARSRNFFDNGDIERAQVALEEALATQKDSPWVRLELAQLLLKRGNSERARALMEELALQKPDDSEALHASAEFAYDDARYFDGLAFLERVSAERRTPAMATLQNRLWIQLQVRRAIALARGDRFAKARRALVDAENVAGSKPEMAGPLAYGWIELGDDERALSIIRTALRLDPDIDLQLQYAGLLLRSRRNDELEQVLENLRARRDLTDYQLAEVEHIDVSYALRESDRLLRDRDFARAYSRIEPFLDNERATPDVQMMLGRLYDASEDHEEALGRYLAILEATPRHMDARRAATGALMRRGEFARAEDLVGEGLAQHPEHPRMHLLSGQLAASRGQTARARENFEKALALVNRSPASDAGSSASADVLTATLALPGNGAGSEQELQSTSIASALPVSLLDTRSTRGVLPLADVIGLREEILTEIARAEAQRSGLVRIGGPFRNRSGEEGFGKLTAFGVPVRAEFSLGQSGRIGIDAEASTIDAGSLQLADERRRLFGAVALSTQPLPGDALSVGEEGFSGSVSYDSRYVGGRIGSTSLGFPVSNVVGNVYVTNASERLRFTARVVRESVDDSVLSHAGLEDPFLGTVWGGVTRSGASLDVEINGEKTGVLGRVGAYRFDGENVADNTMTQLSAGIFWRLAEEQERRLTIGLDIDAIAYERNLGHHTFGHGGYFSPQSYVNLGIPITWSGSSGKLDFSISGKVGFETFEENEAPYYPGDAALQTRLESLAASDESLDTTHAANSRAGIAFRIGGDVSFRLSPRLLVGSDFAIQNAGDFTESRIGIFSTYSFTPQYRNDRNGVFGQGL